LGKPIFNYKIQQSHLAERGTIGIASWGDGNCFAMIVEGGRSGQNALLILQKEKCYISQKHVDFLELPGAFISPIVNPETISFERYKMYIGGIRLGNELTIIAQESSQPVYVGVSDGSVTDMHGPSGPAILRWEILVPDSTGGNFSAFKFDAIPA